MSTTTKALVPCHLESARIGVRVACIAMQGRMPPEDQVTTILASAKGEIELHTFPMEMVTAAAGARKERRRVFAMKALETLLHHCGDTQMLTSDDLDKVVSKSWHIAAAMEREDDVATQLDSLGKK